jgi:hypothetical protein
VSNPRLSVQPVSAAHWQIIVICIMVTEFKTSGSVALSNLPVYWADVLE